MGIGQPERLIDRVREGHEEGVSSASRSARQTRSGVSGRSRITTPVASRTAAATADATEATLPRTCPSRRRGPARRRSQ